MTLLEVERVESEKVQLRRECWAGMIVPIQAVIVPELNVDRQSQCRSFQLPNFLLL